MDLTSRRHFPIRTTAFAKVNLRLKIEGRNQDGYHLLSMLTVYVSLADSVSLKSSSEVSSAKVECTWASGGGDVGIQSDENLVLRAARLWYEVHGLQCASHDVFEVIKRIPVGGGLGGGSSDAAAACTLLDYRTDVPLRNLERLATRALKLGADVPFFMQDKPAWVAGIGEQITPLEIPAIECVEMLLIIPPFGLPTKDVFAAAAVGWAVKSSSYAAPDPHQKSFTDACPHVSYERVVELIENDLLLAAVRLRPPLGDLLTALQSISGVVAGMSGSGSTLFVLPRSRKLYPKLPIDEIRHVANQWNASIVPTRVLRTTTCNLLSASVEQRQPTTK